MKDEDATVSNDTPCPDSESVHSKQYLESLVLVLYLLQRISPDVLDPIIRGVTAYPLHATSLPCPFLQCFDRFRLPFGTLFVALGTRTPHNRRKYA